MFDSSFQQIKQLTQQAALFVEMGEIERCQNILKLRQQSLERLDDEIKSLQLSLSSASDKENFNDIKQQYILLLTWVQQKDASAIVQITELKNTHQKKIINQNKTAHAIKQYTQL